MYKGKYDEKRDSVIRVCLGRRGKGEGLVLSSGLKGSLWSGVQKDNSARVNAVTVLVGIR